MKVKIAVILCLFIGIINSVGIYLLNTLPEKRVVKAQEGVLSLEEWNMGEKGNIILGGEWEFYPGIIITPEQGKDVFAEYSDQRRMTVILNKHYEEIAAGLPIDKGTFRMVIQLGEDGLYGINARGLQRSTAIYMNGTRVCNNGAKKQKGSDDSYLYLSPEGIGQSKDRKIELVIQFHGVGPGQEKIPPMDFGRADSIMRLHDLYIGIDALMFAGFFVLGILFLWSYFYNKKQKYGLFLSLFLLLQSLHTLTESERLFFLIMPPPRNMPLFYRFQVQLVYLSVFFLMMAVYYLLRAYVAKRMVIFFSILLLVIGPLFLWGLFGISRIYGMTLQHHKLIIIVILISANFYILWVMVKSLIKGVEGAEYVMIFTAALLYYALTQTLNFLFGINIQKIPAFLFLIMVICMTLYINYRLQVTLTQVDHLSYQLMQKDRDKDQLLARTSWEMKKLVNDTITISEELLAEAESPAALIRKEELLKVNLESWHIDSILEELMETFGEQPKNMECFPEPVDEAGFTELLDEVNLLLPIRGSVDMKRQLPEEFPVFLADRRKLKEILYYLLHNAVKFTHWGEIEIRIEAAWEKAHITVRDTGIGIDRVQLNAIFTAFYQGKNREEESEGLGLGLTIVKKLVELQGGEIWVVSEPGKGSAFTFSLPLAEKEQETIARGGSLTVEEGGVAASALKKRKPIQKEQNKPLVSGKEVILAVEGVLSAQEEPGRLAETLGYPVETVESGGEALEYIKRNPVDLVLTDLILSDMSGYELCQELRETYNISELPIIILDEKGRAKDMQRSFQSGASDFLMKPVVPEELKARIEARLLAKKSAEGAVMKELKNLHAQIMPHFLYNTLNTIIGLSYKDTEKTCEALQHLSTYFRAKLDFSSYNSFVPLDREIELMKAYLAIEKMRYNDRLEVIYDIDESIHFMIPTLTLQPLVENAVQHGITGKNNKVTIRSSIQRDTDGGYIIKISDNGPGIPEEKQQELLTGEYHRIGFSNVVKKVRLLRSSGIWLESSESSGTCITIYISKEYQYRDPEI